MVLEETKAEELGSPDQFSLPEAGTILDGRYCIGRPLGAGGMGAVFEATNESVKRRCAVKFLRVELAGRSRSLKRFEREARLLGSLVHDNLTAVVDFGFYNQTSPYIVMEYVEGITLRALLARTPQLPIVQVMDLAEQICRGVAHAHRHGIIHRDLKPENVMLTHRSDGADLVKILDFGIAREIGGDEHGTLTPAGADLGTPHYTSPEQARGEGQIDARTDVYSLGVVLYEAVTGEKAHPGETYNRVIFHLLTETPRPIKQLRPDCPKALREVIERCMHQVAARRYASAQELLEVVRGLNAATQSLPTQPTRRNGRFWWGAGVGASAALFATWLPTAWTRPLAPSAELAQASVALSSAPLAEDTQVPVDAPSALLRPTPEAEVLVEKEALIASTEVVLTKATKEGAPSQAKKRTKREAVNPPAASSGAFNFDAENPYQ
ncbi:MAG: hypothetical protein RJA70_1183 [Pseudomonadota bacterium]|jgi:serine/threonine protein kinase